MAGTALTGLQQGSSYAGLIKTTDNLTVDGTLRKLTDGLGVEIPMKVSTANVAIGGTITNDDAEAGYVGQSAGADASSTAVSLTNNTPANLTSVSLTAGDWDVWGIANFGAASASTAITDLWAGISTTSATMPTETGAVTKFPYSVNTANSNYASVPVAPVRVKLASTTTVYLVGQGFFTVAGLNGGGVILARRRR